jgi:serine/threonine-protein kinase
MIGATFGNYRILSQLGAGGMGTVFEALHESIDRRVAIKVLRPEIACSTEFLGRFLTEARASSRITHPGVVQITDFCRTDNGLVFIVMELLNGESLSQRMARHGGRLETGVAIVIARLISSALSWAHKEGIVHRDLKPDNVMLVVDPDVHGGERIKIMDFGIAKLLYSAPVEFDQTRTPTHMQTRSDLIMGTPSYMAPEQCRETRLVNDKADVYALGIVLYQMLSGRVPFTGSTAGDVMAKQICDEPPRLDELVPDLPAAVVAMVHRMLIKDPAARPAMAEVFEKLLVLSASESLTRSACDDLLRKASQSRSRPNTSAASGSIRTRRRWVQISVYLLLATAVIGIVSLVIVSAKPRPSDPSSGRAALRAVTLELKSEPSGASVWQVSSGKLLGRTPLQIPGLPGQQLGQVRISLPQHEDAILDLGVASEGSTVRYHVLRRVVPRVVPKTNTGPGNEINILDF